MSSNRTARGAPTGDSPPFVRLADTRAYQEPPRNPFGLRSQNGSTSRNPRERTSHGQRRQATRFSQQLPPAGVSSRVELTVDDLDDSRIQSSDSASSPSRVQRARRPGYRGQHAPPGGRGSEAVRAKQIAAVEAARVMREITVGRKAKPQSDHRYRTQSFARLVPAGVAPGDETSLQARLQAIRAGTDAPSNSIVPPTASASHVQEPEGPAPGDAEPAAVPHTERVWLQRVEVEADATLDAVQAHRGGKLTLPISSPASNSSSTPTEGHQPGRSEEKGATRDGAARAPARARPAERHPTDEGHQGVAGGQARSGRPERRAEAERVLKRHGWAREQGDFGGGGGGGGGETQDTRGTSRPVPAPVLQGRGRVSSVQGRSASSVQGRPARRSKKQVGAGSGVSAPVVGRQRMAVGAVSEESSGTSGSVRQVGGSARSHAASYSELDKGQESRGRRGSSYVERVAVARAQGRRDAGVDTAAAVRGPNDDSAASSGITPSDGPSASPSASSTQSHGASRAGRLGVQPPEVDRAAAPMSPRRTRRRHDLTKGSQHNALVAVRRMRLMTQLAVAEDDETSVLPGSPRVRPRAGAARYLFEGGRLPPSMLVRGQGANATVTRVPMQKPPAHLLRKPASETSTGGPGDGGIGRTRNAQSNPASPSRRPVRSAARAAERRNSRMLRAVASLSKEQDNGLASLQAALAKEQRRLRQDAGALSPKMARRRSLAARRAMDAGADAKAAASAIDAGAARLVAAADLAIDSESEPDEDAAADFENPAASGALSAEGMSPEAALRARGGASDEKGRIPVEAFEEVSNFLGASTGGSGAGSSGSPRKRAQRALMPFEAAAERLCGEGSVRRFDNWKAGAVLAAEEATLRVRDVRDGPPDMEGHRRLRFALDRCPPAWRLFMSMYEDKILMKHTSSLAVAFRAWRGRATKQFKLRRALVAYVRPKLQQTALASLHRWRRLAVAVRFHRQSLLRRTVGGWKILRAVTIWRRERLLRTRFNVWNVATRDGQQARAAMRLAKSHFARKGALQAIAALRSNVAAEKEARRRLRNSNVFLFVHRGRDYVRRWAQWATSQRAQKQLFSLAQDYYLHRRAKELMARWRGRMQARRVMRGVVQRAQRKSVRRYFNAWRGIAAEGAREKVQMVDAGIYHGLRVSLRVFCAWRDLAMDRIRDKTAVKSFQLRSQRRALSLWRKRAAVTVSLRARGIVASAGRAGRLVSAAWDMWREAHRLEGCVQSLGEWQRQRGLRKGLEALMEHATGRQDRRDKATRAFVFSRFRLYRMGWTGFARALLEGRQERAADAHFRTALAHRALEGWKKHARQAAGMRALQDKFEVALRRVRTQEMLAFWRRWSRNRRWGRSAVAVADVFRRRVTLGGVWVALAHNLAMKRRARDAAERMSVRRELTQVRRCLRGWHSRTFRWELFARKVGLRQSRAAFSALRAACAEQKRARMLEQWVLNMQKERLRTKAFARWVRFLQVVRVERSALEAAENWYLRRLCQQVLQGWKRAAAERRARRSGESSEGGGVGESSRIRARRPDMKRSQRSRAEAAVARDPISAPSAPVSRSISMRSVRRQPSVPDLAKAAKRRGTSIGEEALRSMVGQQKGPADGRQARPLSPLAGGGQVVMVNTVFGPRPQVVRGSRSRSPGGDTSGADGARAGSVVSRSSGRSRAASAASARSRGASGASGVRGSRQSVRVPGVGAGGVASRNMAGGGSGLVRRGSSISISAQRQARHREATRVRDVRQMDRQRGRGPEVEGGTSAGGGGARRPVLTADVLASHAGAASPPSTASGSPDRRGPGRGSVASRSTMASRQREAAVRRELRRQSSMPARGWSVLERVKREEEARGAGQGREDGGEQDIASERRAPKSPSSGMMGVPGANGRFERSDSIASESWHIAEGYETSSRSSSEALGSNGDSGRGARIAGGAAAVRGRFSPEPIDPDLRSGRV